MEGGTTADKEGTTEESREGLLIRSGEGGTTVDTVKKEPLRKAERDYNMEYGRSNHRR